MFGKRLGAATGVSDPSYRGGFADWMDSSGPGFGSAGAAEAILQDTLKTPIVP